MPRLLRQGLEGCDEDIAELYLKTAARQLKTIDAAARSKSMAEIQGLAHKLAGSSAFLGLKAIAKLLRELEHAVFRNESIEAVRLLALIKDEFSQIRRSR